MTSKTKVWVLQILNGILPAILLYLGRYEHVWESITENIKGAEGWEYKYAQTASFILGIVWAALIIPLQLASIKLKLAAIQSRDAEKNKDYRDAAVNVVIRETNLNTAPKVRYFRHRQSRWNRLKFKRFQKEYLEMTEIPGFTDEFAHTLKFEVVPNPEGVVGMAFAQDTYVPVWNLQPNSTYDVRGNGSKLPAVCEVKACFGHPVRTLKPKPLKTVGILSVDCDNVIMLDSAGQKKFNTFVVALVKHVEKIVDT